MAWVSFYNKNSTKLVNTGTRWKCVYEYLLNWQQSLFWKITWIIWFLNIKWIPKRASLFNGPINFGCWSSRERARNTSCWVTVMKNGCSIQHLGGESCSDNNVVVLGWLISSDQHGVSLPQMNVKWVISVLESVCSFHLNKHHLMPLDSEIDGSGKPHIWYPESISLACPKIKYLIINISYIC